MHKVTYTYTLCAIIIDLSISGNSSAVRSAAFIELFLTFKQQKDKIHRHEKEQTENDLHYIFILYLSPTPPPSTVDIKPISFYTKLNSEASLHFREAEFFHI